MYIQKNSEFSGIQELTFDELDEVNGGVWHILIIIGGAIAADAALNALDGISDSLAGRPNRTKS